MNIFKKYQFLSKFLIFSLITVVAFKLWAITLYPITCDESYYWLWHKFLALSYVDHPPVIAIFNKFISFFGANNLFNFRFTTIILHLLVTFFLWKSANLLFNKKVGLYAAIISLLVPQYIVVWQTLTMDNILAVVWVASFYFVAKLYKEQKSQYWYLLGITFGIGMLTKYTMIFFLLPLFLSMLILPELRKWFFRKDPYISILLSVLIFSPVIIWNIQHNFLSLTFHASRLEVQNPINNFLQVLADQLVYFSPIIFIYFLISIRKIWFRSKLVFLFSVPVLGIFFFFTLFIRVWVFWVILYQFAAILGVSLVLSSSDKKGKFFVIGLWVFNAVLVSAIIIGVDAILPRQNEYKQNLLLEKKYKDIPQTVKIITPYLGIASQLTFYSNRRTYMASDYLKVEESGYGQKQFDLWGKPNVLKGESIIYYGLNNDETKKKLEKHFKTVEIRPDLDIFIIESYLDRLVPYYCVDFSGNVNI